MITAQEGDDGAQEAAGDGLAHEGDALDILRRSDAEERGDVGDGRFTGGLDQLRQAVAGGFEVDDRCEPAGGLFEVRRVAGGAGGDEVFAGLGVDHELLRLRATHRAGVGLDGDELQAAAGEDAAVDLVVLVVGDVQAGFVDVEGVGVLHDELTDPQQACLGARLVAELGLDLVPDLRQLLVAAQLVAGNGGHHLFVGHAQAKVGALAILQAKHVGAHGDPAAGFVPDLARQQGREQELLADRVHLLADDRDDLVDRPVAEEEVRVDSRAELAHVSGAQQQLVACHFGVGRGLAQSRNKEFGPAMHCV